MEATAPVYFENSGQWREWLAAHHATSDGIWLLHYRQNSDKPGLRFREALDEALCFGWIDGKLRKVDDEKFVLRYVPRRPGSLWSRLNRGRAEELIRLGRMTETGLAAIAQARGNGNWDEAYTSRVRYEMPEDLRRALSAHPAARANFQRFANSYRNAYIGWVAQARTDATRSRRIAEVVKRAEANLKPGA